MNGNEGTLLKVIEGLQKGASILIKSALQGTEVWVHPSWDV